MGAGLDGTNTITLSKVPCEVVFLSYLFVKDSTRFILELAL